MYVPLTISFSNVLTIIIKFLKYILTYKSRTCRLNQNK